MVRYRMDLNNPPPLTPEQKALAAKPDSEIDFSDIPRLTEEWFARAIPNPYMRKPIETAIHLEQCLVRWL